MLREIVRTIRAQTYPARRILIKRTVSVIIGFDEDQYLAANQDVRAAVTRGEVASGFRHYLRSGRREGRALRERVIVSLEQLDEEIARLRALEQRSFAEWRRGCWTFRVEEDVSRLPSDPWAPEYRAAQMELYRKLAGVAEYDPWQAEPIPISVADSIDPYPFPFSTRDAELIGGHFISLGHVLQALWSLKPGAGQRLLDYGCGTGFTTVMLAASGYDVTAVDINASALRVIDALAETRGLKITTHNGVFGDAPAGAARYEFVLFYEAFHHAIDFVSLLESLHDRVVPGGAVLFAGEPITPDFPKPWGVRLDGASAWEIRTKGWLELGFREDFFLELLQRTGWTASKTSLAGSPDIYIARH